MFDTGYYYKYYSSLDFIPKNPIPVKTLDPIQFVNVVFIFRVK